MRVVTNQIIEHYDITTVPTKERSKRYSEDGRSEEVPSTTAVNYQ